MLDKYTQMWDGLLGRINETENHVGIKIAQYLRTKSHTGKENIWGKRRHETFKRKVGAEAIDSVTSEWAITVVSVLNRNEKFSFCVGYGQLNPTKILETHNITRMDDFIEIMGNVWKFSTLDENLGYWKILVTVRTWKHLLQDVYGCIELWTHKIALRNPPGTFVRVGHITVRSKMEVLPRLFGRCKIHSKNVEDNYEHVEKSLGLLQEIGI